MTAVPQALIPYDESLRFATDCFVALGVSRIDSERSALGLVEADLCGVDTHGIQRLPVYIGRLEKGLINKAPDIRFDMKTPICGLTDGDNGLGFVVAQSAMAKALEISDEFGVAVFGVMNSTHFGMARLYIEQAVKHGSAAIVMTNASPSLPPWGAKKPVLGTSPLAIGFPGSCEKDHFLLDMAPSVAARGKIRKAMRSGQSIPEGWALDGDGKNTTDPARALEGVVLPIGGPKGSGIAMSLDLLCGVLTGAGFAGSVGDQFSVFDRPQNVGHFIIALKPDVFLSREMIEVRMKEWVSTIRSADLADGFDQVFLPGQIETENREQRKITGIPYIRSDIESLNEFAGPLKVRPLEFV